MTLKSSISVRSCCQPDNNAECASCFRLLLMGSAAGGFYAAGASEQAEFAELRAQERGAGGRRRTPGAERQHTAAGAHDLSRARAAGP